MDTQEPAQPQPPPQRRAALWIVAGLAIVVAAVAMYIVPVRDERVVVANQLQRFRQLGALLEQYAKAHDGAFPEELRDPLDPHLPALRNDAATGESINYRIITASGERIGYNFLGDRIIAWSPQASYRGARAVLLNSTDVRFAPDSMIDMTNQRLLGMDTPDLMRPRLQIGDGDGDDDDDEPDEDEPMPDDSPAAQPGG